MSAGNNNYRLERAYLVYGELSDGSYSSSRGYYFQEHSIIHGKDSSISLGEGKPLTREAITDLCTKMLPNIAGELQFLDGNVLATSGMNHGPDVWYIPPVVKAMFFAKGNDIISGLAPWPGMVAVTHKQHIDLYAVKDTVRPGIDSDLYVAPLFNMARDNSSLCTGNSKLPEKSNDYAGWEAVLFQSEFTKEGGDNRIKKGTLTDLWKELITLEMSKFPDKQLVPAGITVRGLLEKLRRGHES